MNIPRSVLILVALLAFNLSGSIVQAQRVETRIGKSEVVYVERKDVVLKLADGDVRQFEFLESSRFIVDGKDLTVYELKPGMKVQAMSTTAVVSRLVDSVETIDVGTVWKTIGSTIIIRTPDGVNKEYRVPAESRITVGGKEVALDQLREGDKITATVVKMASPSEVTRVRHTATTPPRVGALLIDEGAKPEEHPGMWGNTTVIILVIVLALAAILILTAFWRKRKPTSAK